MTQNQIILHRRKSPKILASFPSVPAAIAWKEERQLGCEFSIRDLRSQTDPAKHAERPLLVGYLIRDMVDPLLRAAQYDRLISGASRSLPRRASEGLEIAIAQFGALCLTEAGAQGWSAQEGSYHNPCRNEPRHAAHTSAPVTHAWISHDTGAILDLTSAIFFRSAVTYLDPDEPEVSRFRGAPIALKSEDMRRSAEWIDILGAELVPALRHLGAARMIPQPAPDPTPPGQPGMPEI